MTEPTTEVKAVRQAYRRAALRAHPDKGERERERERERETGERERERKKGERERVISAPSSATCMDRKVSKIYENMKKQKL